MPTSKEPVSSGSLDTDSESETDKKLKRKRQITTEKNCKEAKDW